MTWQAELEEQGVARIPGVFTTAEANEIRSAAHIALTQIKGGKNHLQICKASGHDSPGLLLWPALSNQTLNRFRCDQRLAGIVREALGPDVKQINNQVYYRLPGDGDSFAWHQDQVFRKPPEDFPGIESGYLQTIIVVDEITEDNAPVEYLPGSHRDVFPGNPDQLSPKLRKFTRDGHAGIKLTAKPGDVVVWSVMVVHGSEPNGSQRPRMTYMNGFARADCSRFNPLYMSQGRVIPVIDYQAFK